MQHEFRISRFSFLYPRSSSVMSATKSSPIVRSGSNQSRSDPVDTESSNEVKALFTKLFRNKGNKISVSSAPPPGNKLQTAIWDGMMAIMNCRKNRDFKPVYSFPSPLPNLTVMEIPSSFSTSSASNLINLMQQVDEEYGIMSGYVQHPSESSFVIMLGALRRRRAAELKLMATIETKLKGFYSHRIVRDGLRVCDQPWYVSTVDFDTDSYPIPPNELSFALGHKGAIRKKLAMASGCIIEYVGEVAYFSGTLVERTRGRDYLRWVLQQLQGEVLVAEYQRRIDIAYVPLRTRQGGYVNGNKGRLLRATEELTGCFCFVAKTVQPTDTTKPLIICGVDSAKDAGFFALDKYLKDHQNSSWNEEASAAGSDDPNSIEALKGKLDAILKKGNFAVRKPKEPWRVGSNESINYVWLSQPCPGAAREDAEISNENLRSDLMLSKPIASQSNKNQSSMESKFVNDAMSFPELGVKKASVVSPEPVIVKKPEVVMSPAAPNSPSVDGSRNAAIYIDKEKGQIWGDWGLGPHGDPEFQKPAASAPHQNRLLGAWK